MAETDAPVSHRLSCFGRSPGTPWAMCPQDRDVIRNDGGLLRNHPPGSTTLLAVLFLLWRLHSWHTYEGLTKLLFPGCNAKVVRDRTRSVVGHWIGGMGEARWRIRTVSSLALLRLLTMRAADISLLRSPWPLVWRHSDCPPSAPRSPFSKPSSLGERKGAAQDGRLAEGRRKIIFCYSTASVC